MKTPSEQFLENSQRMAEKFEISIVVVGDSQCGKTQLINRFQNFKFSKVGSNIYGIATRSKLILVQNLTEHSSLMNSANLLNPVLNPSKLHLGVKAGATQSRDERIMLNRTQQGCS